MTDPSMSPEAPNVADTARFLRRFADLMSNTYNATYLQRAAELLETMTARVLAASDEDEHWRRKYEILADHASALEAECEALKLDIEGHLNVTSSILSERVLHRCSRENRNFPSFATDSMGSTKRSRRPSRRTARNWTGFAANGRIPRQD